MDSSSISHGNGADFPPSPVTSVAVNDRYPTGTSSNAPSPPTARLASHPASPPAAATTAATAPAAAASAAPPPDSIHDGTVVDESAACGVPILDPAALAAMRAVYSSAASSPAASPASLQQQQQYLRYATHHHQALLHHQHQRFMQLQQQQQQLPHHMYAQSHSQPTTHYPPSHFVQPQFQRPVVAAAAAAASAVSNATATRQYQQQQEQQQQHIGMPPPLYPAATSYAASPSSLGGNDDTASMTYPPHRLISADGGHHQSRASHAEPTVGTVVGLAMPPQIPTALPAAGNAETQAIFAAAAMAALHDDFRRQHLMMTNYAALYGGGTQRPLPPPLPSTHAAVGADAARAGTPQHYQHQQTPHQQLAEQLGVGQWTTSLCACLMDPSSALDSFLCFRCQASRQRNVLLNGTNDLDCSTLWFTLAADVMLAVVGLPSLAQLLLVAEIRRTLRTRYGIAGTSGRDFTEAMCCHCCVLAQHYREMSVRGEWPSGECVTRPFLNGLANLQEMV